MKSINKFFLTGLVLWMLVLISFVNADLQTNLTAGWEGNINNSYPDVLGTYPGNITGATFENGGKMNGYYSFDGSGDIIDINNGAGNEFEFGTVAEDRTITMWLRPTGTGIIMSKATSEGSRWYAELLAGGEILIAWAFSNSVFTTDLNMTNTSKWYNLVMVYNNTAPQLQFYLDGNNVENVSVGGTRTPSSQTLQIGGLNSYVSSYGQVDFDQILFYNRSLSPTEIIELYNNDNGLEYPFSATIQSNLTDYYNTSNITIYASTDINGSLFSYVHSGNVSEVIYNDGTLNGYTFNDGTLNGFSNTTRNTSCRGITYNNCLEFDAGNNNYITSNVALNTSTATVCLWINYKNVNSGADYIYDFRTSAGSGYAFIDSARNVNVNSGTVYKNGVVGNTLTFNQWDHLCIAGQTIASTSMFISRFYASNVNHINGTLDEIYVFDRTLNSTEVLEQYNSRNPIIQPVASYSFEENKGNTTFDTNFLVQGNTTEERFNRALAFDGVNDYVEQATLLDSGLTTGTICQWVYANTDSSTQYTLTKENTASNDRLYFQYNFPSNQQISIRFALNGGGLISSSGSLPYNTWTHVCGTFDNTNQTLYINGVKADSDANSGILNAGTTSNFRLGVRTSTSDYFNGSIDNLRIYNKSLSSTEVAQLYNRTYYNTSSLVFSTSAEQIDNTQVYDRSTQLFYNGFNSTVNTILTEGFFTYAFRELSTNSESFELFTIDLTNPSLINNIPTEINFFNRTINLSSYISVDYGISGENSCTVVFNNSQTANCDNESFKFDTAGNFTYTITAIDNANNTATNNSEIYVNPNQIFRVLDVYSGVYLSNYTLELNGAINYTSENDSNFTLINIFDFNIEQDNILKVRTTGYSETSRTFNVTLDSQLNETINTTTALVLIEFRDRDTNVLIDFETISFTIVGDSFAQSYTTSNGTAEINDFNDIPDTYEITSDSESYEQNVRQFTFNGLSNLSLNIYLLNSSNPAISTLTIIVRDQSLDELPGILVTVRRYDITTNDYIAIEQKETNDLGQADFVLDFNDKYQFVLSDGVNTVTTEGQFITDTPLFLLFDPTGDSINIGDNVNIYSVMYKVIVSNETHQFKWDYNDPTNTISQACLEVYLRNNGNDDLIDIQCSNSTSGSINSPNSGVFSTNFSKKYTLVGYVILNGERIEVDVQEFIFFKYNDGWGSGFGLLFILAFYFMLIMGAVLANQVDPYIFIGMGMVPLFIAAAFQALPATITSVVAFVALIIFVLLTRKQ